MNQIRIALAQSRQTADREDNRRAVFAAMENAAAQHVQILCFPETQTVGYRADIVAADAAVPTDWLDQVHGEVAAGCARLGMACILGTEISSDGGNRTTARW